MRRASPTGPRRQSAEAGFTLIELLVVILIIGILAAIALPVLTDQSKKGQDASAKSNARNVWTLVQGCFAEKGDYAGCTTQAELDAYSFPFGGIGINSPAGTVQVNATSSTAAEVFAVSGSKRYFVIRSTSPSASVIRFYCSFIDGTCGSW